MADIDVDLMIDNCYDDGTVSVQTTTTIPAPPTEDRESDEWEDWAYDNLFVLTGTGREEGDAGYFVTIRRCEQRPDLAGAKFEWGI